MEKMIWRNHLNSYFRMFCSDIISLKLMEIRKSKNINFVWSRTEYLLALIDMLIASSNHLLSIFSCFCIIANYISILWSCFSCGNCKTIRFKYFFFWFTMLLEQKWYPHLIIYYFRLFFVFVFVEKEPEHQKKRI